MGAGMSGILAGVRLPEAGENNFTIYDKGDRLGGTWRENRYPGLTCDVPAHAYTYSFAPNPDWSAFYAPGPEICEYFDRVFHEHGLDNALRLNREIRACEYGETARKWHLTSADGSSDSADVVIAATGVLHHPKMPEIPGIDAFAGQSCHSARWDDDIVIDAKRVDRRTDSRRNCRQDTRIDPFPALSSMDDADRKFQLHRRRTRGVGR